MARLLAQFGDYRGIARGELIDVLTNDEAPVAFHSTVTELIEEPDAVRVSVSVAGVPHWLAFDLVVIADGLHSQTRDLVLRGRPVEVVDTKWGGWVAWAPGDAESDLVEELWGAGFFVGMYPVQGELGVFVGGPRTDSAHGAPAFVAEIRRRLETVPPRLDRALTAVADDPDPFYWSLTDCRAPTWTTGRTVLLGDAAAGFLPTAGIGAGMAMESAWMLGRLLSRADPSRLADVLKSYERIQRPRVESAQRNSRQLATMMFRRSRMLAYLREIALRAVSVERAIRPIQRLLQDRRDPDAVIGAMRSDSADH
jgi:2-polyprenyl-6-methoxyphenol hydroxylase-like FAD-dependent oxidoreductase